MKYSKRKDKYCCEVLNDNFHEIDDRLETLESFDYDDITVDDTLSKESENPVQNKVITLAMDNLVVTKITNAELLEICKMDEVK